MQPGAFRTVPRTGVIYVMSEASRLGYRQDDPAWSNLGQGMPEAGELPGAPPRVRQVQITDADQEYAPVAGIWELREAVASMYNDLFRRGRGSKYSAENVAIAGGGRVSIMRACAAIGTVNLGHFLPDYTAYEELLDVFRRFIPIPVLLDPERGYSFTIDELRREILGRGLGAVLLSNPCNPTGKLIAGTELEQWVAAARELDCTLLTDEFYSHYIWSQQPSIVSAAEYVEDVDRDPVVIFDGLTKNWRYPGWRTTWIVAPKPVIEAAASAGSFLDGGGSRPLQRAAVEIVTAEHARSEGAAIHAAFGAKRDRLVAGLRDIGVRFDVEPEGTFYAWGDVSGLPGSLRNCDDFFRMALEEKVITVPGKFFDVDPGQRRLGRASRFKHHVRFSFGPAMASLEQAIARLKARVGAAR
ncbi:MAG TPA: pyridoxal phosphate-dependent aminotransferase [Polyangiaceae bacterium]|nr:pyridoxal phosphate-dependent aminotransferase [Polyangiaceae bacterium]HMR73970.1 pyridoxal phosphate-dependent aminotransferase [Polyangiaceae bacterium]